MEWIGRSTSHRVEAFATDLGVELGPLTVALFRLADRISGDEHHEIGSVSDANPYCRCDFYVDFPEPFRHITPTNVVLFGSTGVDCNQFGFRETDRSTIRGDE